MCIFVYLAYKTKYAQFVLMHNYPISVIVFSDRSNWRHIIITRLSLHPLLTLGFHSFSVVHESW